MGTIRNRREDIVILRLISMVMIILCHIIPFYKFIPGSQFLGQILSVGVNVFLMISGYIYGLKKTLEFPTWILQRVRRIWVPVFLVVVVDLLVLVLFCSERFPLLTILVYCTNLQGLLFINWDFFYRYIREINNLGPLWFTTVIVFCYWLLPLFRYLDSRFRKTAVHGVILAVFVALCIVLKIFCGMDLMYFAVFYLGFLLAARQDHEKKMRLSHYCILAAVVCLIQMGRLYLRSVIDGTTVYWAYISFSHLALGLLIFVTVMELGKRLPKLFEKIANLKIAVWMDKVSFYIFLTHGIFCMGRTNVFAWIPNPLVATPVFFGLVLIASLILYWADTMFDRLFRKKPA